MLVPGEEGNGRARFVHCHDIEPLIDLHMQIILTACLNITQWNIGKCR